ncbi:hypothetical protein BX661DRAFT_173140 [Kickxella alabastrina]|uniref:uncharacterized protein n=1 Tax=Kickxella alabastrina TaxID=61397 RepID=UPI002220047C|nr:uncharacterized protein BX661DRAFT_173140 [Kickxella alabastrina]KAI7822081.1 hypothetical protein BX661DRAFT_173140 [Kickxella alabastrina]
MSTLSVFQTLPWHNQECGSDSKKVDISWVNVVYGQTNQHVSGLLGKVTLELYRGLKRVSFLETGSNKAPAVFNSATFLALTHFTYKCTRGGHIWAIECIRRNTASLKKLSFMHVHRYIAAAILHDGQDNPLVYCSLESIYFDSVDFQIKFVRPTRSETPAKFVYFPKLEFLRVHGRYPYNYNMLFRGEDGHSTLKSLKITLELTFIETELFKFPRASLNLHKLLQFSGVRHICAICIAALWAKGSSSMEFALLGFERSFRQTSIHGANISVRWLLKSDFSRYKFNREKDMFTNKMFYGYHFDRMNINVSNKPEIVVNRRERVIFFLLLWDAYIV